MEEALIQAAIQVPALLVVSYVLLTVTRMVMDIQGRKLDDLTQAVENLVAAVRERRRR